MRNTNQHISLRPGYRFQWEEAQQAHVLLYPEGMVKLNDSASEILKRCDQTRTVQSLIDELSDAYPNMPEIESDVIEFLQVAQQNGWVDINE